MPENEDDVKDEDTSEDLEDSSTSEDEEDSDDSKDESDDTKDNADNDKDDDSDEDEEKDELKVPLTVLKKERVKRKNAEKRLRDFTEKKDLKSTTPGSKEQDDAKSFLRGLMTEVLNEREAEKTRLANEEDDMYDEMLEEFAELDSKFNSSKFSKLMVKYKPSDKDSAWEIWKEFGEKTTKSILNSKSKPKHILPKAKKTVDKTKSKPYKPGSGKQVYQVVEEAIRENYGDTEGY